MYYAVQSQRSSDYLLTDWRIQNLVEDRRWSALEK